MTPSTCAWKWKDFQPCCVMCFQLNHLYLSNLQVKGHLSFLKGAPLHHSSSVGNYNLPYGDFATVYTLPATLAGIQPAFIPLKSNLIKLLKWHEKCGSQTGHSCQRMSCALTTCKLLTEVTYMTSVSCHFASSPVGRRLSGFLQDKYCRSEMVAEFIVLTSSTWLAVVLTVFKKISRLI